MARFKKAYQGPFEKKEAEALVKDLKGKTVFIENVEMRKRKGVKQYDVYIK